MSSAVVTAGNLGEYKCYLFTWFADAALRLALGYTLDDLGGENARQLLGQLYEWVSGQAGVEELDRSPLPLGSKDAEHSVTTLRAALSTLARFAGGERLGAGFLPSSIAIDFAEHVRVAGGPGRKKREALKASDEVVALSMVGAYLTLAYTVPAEAEVEYGYVLLSLHPQLAPLSLYREAHGAAKRLTRRLASAGAGFFPILLGAAASVAWRIPRSAREGPVRYEYLRLVRRKRRAGWAVSVRGFDSVDVSGLAALIWRGGIAGSLGRLLSRYPSQGYGAYRAFVECLSRGLVLYHLYRRPQHLYAALRALHSAELNRDGRALLGNRWDRVASRLASGLPRLVS